MIDQDRTAVLVIDMQNDFCHVDGYYARKGMPVDQIRKAIPAVQRLLAVARRRSIPIVYTRLVHDPRAADVMARHRVLPAGWVADDQRLAPGSWGAEVIDELSPAGDDVVVDKSDYSAFYQTGLEAHLRRRGVRALLVAGTTAYACVLHTAFDAFCRDFDVTICREAVSSWFPDLTDAALRMTELLLGRVASADELARELDR